MKDRAGGQPACPSEARKEEAAMPNLAEILQSLVSEPRETRNIELKSWINPESAEGIQKIARAALALRNENGGYLVIGFNDRTCQPDPLPSGLDARTTYHTDEIQRIVSKYASPAFVYRSTLSGKRWCYDPVIQIPAGVRTPAVCKANFSVQGSDGRERFLLRQNNIYVRTVATNGTISSASGNSEDIAGLVDRCFENREADQTVVLSKVFQAIPGADLPAIFAAISRMAETCAEAIRVDRSDPRGWRAALPDSHGGKTGLSSLSRISGYRIDNPRANRNVEPTYDFLRALKAARPKLSGWPIWQVTETPGLIRLSIPIF